MADQVTAQTGVTPSTTLQVPLSGHPGVDRALTQLVQILADQFSVRNVSAVADVSGTATGFDSIAINEIKAQLNTLLESLRTSGFVTTSTTSSSTYSTTSSSTTISLTSSSSTVTSSSTTYSTTSSYTSSTSSTTHSSTTTSSSSSTLIT